MSNKIAKEHQCLLKLQPVSETLDPNQAVEKEHRRFPDENYGYLLRLVSIASLNDIEKYCCIMI